ncbi:MAG: NfeD family protein [Proteobacteria bacterium]|nr:NfeD family protein [Pseudomonadota bacterium]
MDIFVPYVGGWFWWIVAIVLLIGELFAPGVFLIWLAGAAALTGLIDLVFGLDWRMEIATFAALSVILVLASWRYVMAGRKVESDAPHLNRRHEAYVGRTVPLADAIVNGSGKVRIEDALWEVNGPDLPSGALVKITGVDDARLKVVKA